MNAIPIWYLSLASVWSSYQGVRGIIETRINLEIAMSANEPSRIAWTPWWKKVVVLDIHDFWFRFICTMAGFASLYVSYLLGLHFRQLPLFKRRERGGILQG